MKTWLTSDTHFYHENVIRYCNRPFSDMVDMNREMIKRWNARVGPRDIVYHLGDFCMGPRAVIAPTLKKLNGEITLIRGNHDRSITAMKEAGFKAVLDNLTTMIDGHMVTMRHKPFKLDESLHHPSKILLCGHVHNLFVKCGKTYNVGVDVWDFQPVTLEEILNDARRVTGWENSFQD